jgi:hypothetical protein
MKPTLLLACFALLCSASCVDAAKKRRNKLYDQSRKRPPASLFTNEKHKQRDQDLTDLFNGETRVPKAPREPGNDANRPWWEDPVSQPPPPRWS